MVSFPSFLTGVSKNNRKRAISVSSSSSSFASGSQPTSPAAKSNGAATPPASTTHNSLSPAIPPVPSPPSSNPSLETPSKRHLQLTVDGPTGPLNELPSPPLTPDTPGFSEAHIDPFTAGRRSIPITPIAPLTSNPHRDSSLSMASHSSSQSITLPTLHLTPARPLPNDHETAFEGSSTSSRVIRSYPPASPKPGHSLYQHSSLFKNTVIQPFSQETLAGLRATETMAIDGDLTSFGIVASSEQTSIEIETQHSSPTKKALRTIRRVRSASVNALQSFSSSPSALADSSPLLPPSPHLPLVAALHPPIRHSASNTSISIWTEVIEKGLDTVWKGASGDVEVRHETEQSSVQTVDSLHTVPIAPLVVKKKQFNQPSAFPPPQLPLPVTPDELPQIASPFEKALNLGLPLVPEPVNTESKDGVVQKGEEEARPVSSTLSDFEGLPYLSNAPDLPTKSANRPAYQQSVSQSSSMHSLSSLPPLPRPPFLVPSSDGTITISSMARSMSGESVLSFPHSDSDKSLSLSSFAFPLPPSTLPPPSVASSARSSTTTSLKAASLHLKIFKDSSETLPAPPISPFAFNFDDIKTSSYSEIDEDKTIGFGHTPKSSVSSLASNSTSSVESEPFQQTPRDNANFDDLQQMPPVLGFSALWEACGVEDDGFEKAGRASMDDNHEEVHWGYAM